MSMSCATFTCPGWMQPPGMGVDKLSAFYRDPVKVACDLHSMNKAFSLRSDSIDEGVAPGARRWGRFLKGVARGIRGEAPRPQAGAS